MSHPVLEFTGERFTPECVREIWYEHIHRYAFAAPLARGCRVLDAACGEGYGSALLAARARSVLGVDLSKEAIDHARARYPGLGNLAFQVADVTALGASVSGQFDLIVSFETLEHVEGQEAMLADFARLLAPGGMLLVSTPDKRVYTEASGQSNPFHVRELYRDEFQSLIGRHFPAFRLLGQKLLFQSAIWHVGATDRWTATTHGKAEAGLAYEPVYWIAACSNQAEALDALPSLDLFGDAEESVYRHYNEEVRRNMQAGHRIQELERELEALRRQLAGGDGDSEER